TNGQSKIGDWNALIYVLDSDLDANGKLKANVPREPLVLRAAAGDCISVELTNKLKPVGTEMNVGDFAQAPWNENATAPFTPFTLMTSHDVGIHAQLVAYDITQSDGFNIGTNQVETVPPGGHHTYTWYAGRVT